MSQPITPALLRAHGALLAGAAGLTGFERKTCRSCRHGIDGCALRIAGWPTRGPVGSQAASGGACTEWDGEPGADEAETACEAPASADQASTNATVAGTHTARVLARI